MMAVVAIWKKLVFVLAWIPTANAVESLSSSLTIRTILQGLRVEFNTTFEKNGKIRKLGSGREPHSALLGRAKGTIASWK
jgi:hypothetical protein